MTGLEVRSLSKQYEGRPLLQGISFAAGTGETLCLLGASGSGKSTLLRIIAGLERPDGGTVAWGGQDLAGVPPHQRRFGLMFQDYALFPHLSVTRNIAFGLEVHHWTAPERQLRVDELLARFDLQGLRERPVQDLSGGEQQRVALARTLATRPRLLLLDEPLAALDRGLRRQLLGEVRAALRETGTPAVYVTHDQEEAFMMADRLLLLEGGVIRQAGTPEEVYTRPASREVAAFFGMQNQLPAILRRAGDGWRAESPAGTFRLAGAVPGAREGAPATLVLRQAFPGLIEGGAAAGTLTGRVLEVRFTEDGYATTLEAGGIRLTFLLEARAAPGEVLRLQIRPGDLSVFVQEVP